MVVERADHLGVGGEKADGFSDGPGDVRDKGRGHEEECEEAAVPVGEVEDGLDVGRDVAGEVGTPHFHVQMELG